MKELIVEEREKANYYSMNDSDRNVTPPLCVTMGDINGIGPEVIARAAHDPAFWSAYPLVVIGDVAAYEASRLPGDPRGVAVDSVGDAAGVLEGVPILELAVECPPRRPGHLDGEAGRCAVEWIREGVRLAMEGVVSAVVTCPINKVGVHMAGFPFPGHTEFVAELSGARVYRMCLFSDTLRIVHVSGHLSLREALDWLSVERIAESIRIGHDALVRIGTAHRRVGVAGLNPHAGENGAFGTEEIEIIAPAVALCRSEGIDCSGPFSPDTIFKRMRDGEFDLVVAMYHDQGLIPAKLVEMDSGVNVTLGLPIVRTSVDHGTAYEIAGKNIASDASLRAAIRFAAELCGSHSESRSR